MGVQGAKPPAEGTGERCLGDSVKGPPNLSLFCALARSTYDEC